MTVNYQAISGLDDAARARIVLYQSGQFVHAPGDKIGLQLSDPTLTALAALNATPGIVVQTGTDTFTKRTLAAPAAGITITNPAGTSGNPTFALANDLAALEGLGSTGIAARTAADTWAQRTITGTANQITVANGDGVSGNPTLSLPSAINLNSGTLTTTGSVATGALTATGTATVTDTASAVLNMTEGDTAKTWTFVVSNSDMTVRENGAGGTTRLTIAAGGTTTFSGIIQSNNTLQVETFSATGATAGWRVVDAAATQQSSVVSTAATSHIQFFNPNGNVGAINTSASATAFVTSSDENLKIFHGEYDPVAAIDIIRRDPVRTFEWKSDGALSIGWGAQTSYAISPDLATPGRGKPGEESYQPWGVDLSRRTPYLWAALTYALDKIKELEARLADLEAAT